MHRRLCRNQRPPSALELPVDLADCPCSQPPARNPVPHGRFSGQVPGFRPLRLAQPSPRSSIETIAIHRPSAPQALSLIGVCLLRSGKPLSPRSADKFSVGIAFSVTSERWSTLSRDSRSEGRAIRRSSSCARAVQRVFLVSSAADGAAIQSKGPTRAPAELVCRLRRRSTISAAPQKPALT